MQGPRRKRRSDAAIDADCLLVSGGWSPVVNLASQAGALRPSGTIVCKPSCLRRTPTAGVGAGGVRTALFAGSRVAEGLAAGSGKADGDTPDVIRLTSWMSRPLRLRDRAAGERPSSTSSTT